MSIKGILVGGVVALMLSSSCSKEELISEPPLETGTFSISFSSETVKSKAGEASTTTSNSTTEELTVSSCFIAVYMQGEGGVWNRLQSSKTVNVTSDEDGKFTVSGLVLPINTPLKVVAIANPPSDLTGSDVSTYDKLAASTTTYSAELGGEDYLTFNPSTLIKVGEKEMTFDNGTSTPTSTITLKQLAAKIQLNLNIQPKEEGSAFTLQAFKIQNIETCSPYILPNTAGYTGVLKDKEVTSLPTDAIAKLDTTFYTYERPSAATAPLTILLKGAFDKSPSYTYNLEIKPKVDDNGILRGNVYEVTGTIKDQAAVFTVSFVPWVKQQVDVTYE